MGNQRYKLRIGAHWGAFFVEDLVFVHRPTVDFSSGRSARRENNLLPSNLLILVTTTIITGTLKGWQRGRIQHPRFREAPRQISSSFVLPFARCQLMNSVCLGRRTDKYTLQIHARTYLTELSSPHKSHISILGSARRSFPEGVLRVMLGEQLGRDGKMRSTLKSKVIRANVRDVKPPTAHRPH